MGGRRGWGKEGRGEGDVGRGENQKRREGEKEKGNKRILVIHWVPCSLTILSS